MSQDGKLHKTGERSAFFGRQERLDTVVFVHGLRGHFMKTWGRFPALIASDPDLPKLDIFLWGYRTGMIRPLVGDMETVGGEFMSELKARMEPDNALHLVGHSFGGLVVLKGIVSEMIAMRAQQDPTSSVCFVSLFGTPVSGSTAAAMVRQTVGVLGVVGAIVNKQIRSLARGREVDDLLTAVVDRVYAPVLEDSSRRRIPIRMVMGSRDRAVSETDRVRASARFGRTMPLAFDYGHWNIKEPTDHDDQRYQALSRDIQEGLAHRFHRICAALESDRESKEGAVIEFQRRYEHILRRRLEDFGVDTVEQDALYKSYLTVIIRDCRRHVRPPYYAADRALTILIERGLVGGGQ